MKKLCVCDFDGTIYANGDKRRFYAALEELAALRKSGGEYIVASGRPLHLLRPFFKDFDSTYFISCDGALFSKGFDIIKSFPINKEEINKKTEKTKSDYVLTGQCISYIHCSDSARRMQLCRFYGGHTVSVNHAGEIDEDIYKAAFFCEDTECGFLDKCWNSYGICEYVAKGVSKGLCLEAARAVLGFDMEDTLVIGDGENDISMMKTAGKSYAVASAPPVVKYSADAVVDDIIRVLRGEFA